jgi:epsilon-lactone hydrolase
MASPALDAIIVAKRANPFTPDKSVEQLREEYSSTINIEAMPKGTTITEVDAGGVTAEWTRAPGAATDCVFLFIHGGGYIRGAVVANRVTAALISAASGATTLSTGYRLAPENPFPAAIDDVYNAYRWLLAQDIDPKRIVVGGISAGGGLTLSLLLKLKELGDPMPVAAVPMSAWTDLTQSGQSFVTNDDSDPSLSKGYLDATAAYYLNGADPRTPLASPYFGELDGLPPLLIQVGTAEVLLDDSRLFAERAKAAGTEVTFEPWQDMIHGWHGFANVLPEARDAIASAGRFFKHHVK